MNVAAYDMVFTPGSIEGGKGTTAHWLQSVDLPRDTDLWILGAWLYPADCPDIDDWGIVTNLHVASGENGYDGNNSSPGQVDVSDGGTKYVTHGGGTWVDDANQQFHGTEKHVFPLDGDPAVVWGEQPRNVRGVWQDFALHTRLVEDVGFFDLFLNAKLFASAKGISTIYTGQSKVELWTGLYLPTRPDDGAANAGKTFHMQVCLPRVGATFAEAYMAACAPAPPSFGGTRPGWGAGQVDTSVITALPGRAPESFSFPAELLATLPSTPVPASKPSVDAAGGLAHAVAALAKLRASADYKSRLKVSPGKAFARTALGMCESELAASIKALGG